MSTQHSTRLQTAHQLLDAFGSLSLEVLSAPMAEEFKHTVLPESLGMPTRDKAAFLQHATIIFGVFDSLALTPKSVFEDPERNVVVINARMQGELKDGKGEWKNEMVMIIYLSDDGTKVVEVEEFIDSVKALEMRTRIKPKDF